MAMADVTIYGAGIMGLSLAYVCAMRGAKVQVIDPNGVGAGSSGGIVGALAPHVPENWNAKKQFQFESLIMAEDFWVQVESIGGMSAGYLRSGRLQPIADDTALALAQERGQNAQTLWQGSARWSIVPASDFGDWAPVSPTGYLIHDTLSARMFPRHACRALAAAVIALGGNIVADGAASGQIVHATGWQGLRETDPRSGKPIGNGVKGQAALLHYSAPNAPQLFADALHIIPHANGTVAIGSTSERNFDDEHSTDDQIDDIIARARAAFPVLANAEVIERWAGVRPRAMSLAPIMGHHPARVGEYILNGGFKIGFGMAPKLAQMMADFVLDGTDAIPDEFRS